MTDFHSSAKTSWKKAEVSAKWRNLLGAFIVVVLLLAAVNGIFKSINLGKNTGKAQWDGQSPFSTVLNTNPVSVVIYNPSSKILAQFVLGNELYVETGSVAKPLVKLSEVSNAKDLTGAVSHAFGAPVSNYAEFRQEQGVSEASMQADFKNFASILFPIKLLFGFENLKDTNIARSDLLRLWWQAKSLSLNSLAYVDLGKNSEDIILSGGEKVMGVDTPLFHRQILSQMENSKLVDEGKSIEIVNGAGDAIWGKLAAQFVGAYGGKVTKLTDSEQIMEKTTIMVSKNSYTATYLAKVFNCDIKSVPNSQDERVQIFIGRDFAQNY